ncbi:MAG: tetratricopeptide repeat protein [Bacteroidales bacterium]
MDRKTVNFTAYRNYLFIILVSIFIVPFIITAFGQTKKTSDTPEYKLPKAKGKERIEILKKLISKYTAEDSTKAFDYFKEVVKLADESNLDWDESNAFDCLLSGLNNERSVGRLKTTLEYFQKKNYKKGIGLAYIYMGRQYLSKDNYPQAEQNQNMALKTFTGIDYQYGIALANERLGVIFIVKNEYLKALRYYYQALKINQNKGYKREEATSLYHIGLANMYLGNYPEAVDYILKSLRYWERIKYTPNVWNCNELLGNIYINLKVFDKALYYHRIALKVRNDAIKISFPDGRGIRGDNKLGLAYSYNNIAEVYLNLHNYDSAYYYALKSMKIKIEKNSYASTNDVANSEANLGKIYGKLQKYDSAFLLLNKAANTYKDLQNKSSYGEALYGIGNLYFDLKNYSKAKENYEAGLNNAIEVGDKSNIKTGYILLSDLYKAKHDYQKSLDFFNSYSGMKDSIFDEERSNAIEELQIKYEVDKKQQKIESQELTIAHKKRQFTYSLIGGSLILLFAIGFIVLVLKNKRQKEILLQKEAENLRKDLELKNRELVCNVSNIYTKNMVIRKVAKTLSISMSNFKEANMELIRDIISELKQNMDETSWKEFEYRFSKVHESFYKTLDDKFPELTHAERKVCAMLKLNMSSKEIASITMTLPESIDTTRSRIRKKLGLEKDENLTEFLNKL